ncbi:MAG: hypothetical protein P4L51_15105 [Puia sp.]|nr:hypothetical protein [Puia sp.]
MLPTKVKKGREGMLTALLRSGIEAKEVKRLTGALLHAVERIARSIVAELPAGKEKSKFGKLRTEGKKEEETKE